MWVRFLWGRSPGDGHGNPLALALTTQPQLHLTSGLSLPESCLYLNEAPLLFQSVDSAKHFLPCDMAAPVSFWAS